MTRYIYCTVGYKNSDFRFLECYIRHRESFAIRLTPVFVFVPNTFEMPRDPVLCGRGVRLAFPDRRVSRIMGSHGSHELYNPEDCLVTSSVYQSRRKLRVRLEPLQGHVGVFALKPKETCESIDKHWLDARWPTKLWVPTRSFTRM